MSEGIGRFEDLKVWKEAMHLSAELYKSLKDCKNYGLRDQIFRSAVSIPSNIAEGFERQSNKEFIQFLYIASLYSQSFLWRIENPITDCNRN
jgi:hypothetical protein